MGNFHWGMARGAGTTPCPCWTWYEDHNRKKESQWSGKAASRGALRDQVCVGRAWPVCVAQGCSVCRAQRAVPAPEAAWLCLPWLIGPAEGLGVFLGHSARLMELCGCWSRAGALQGTGLGWPGCPACSQPRTRTTAVSPVLHPQLCCSQLCLLPGYNRL